ncbi:MAG: hypothetical protein AAFY26_18705 [Cyanobacteria bacterium J06638_22]
MPLPTDQRPATENGSSPGYVATASDRPVKQRPLGDWVGDRVLWDGRLDYWEPFRRDRIRFVLTMVAVRHWATGEIRCLDHLWFMTDKEHFNQPSRQRYCHVVGNGIVYEYSRRDGTRDYGVQQGRGASLERIAESIEKSLAQNGDREIAQIQNTLNRLYEDWEQGAIIAPYDIDKSAVAAELESFNTQIERKLQTKGVQQVLQCFEGCRHARKMQSFAAPGFKAPRREGRSVRGVG